MLGQRALLYALLWWLLTEERLESWYLGIPLVLLVAAVSHRIAPSLPRSTLGLLRFIPFFVFHSLKGGIDVAWRALHPALPISPVLVDYRLRLPDEQARVFMANTVSLVPGTLCAGLEGRHLQVHVLEGGSDFRRELEALERRIAALFRLSLAEPDDDRL